MNEVLANIGLSIATYKEGYAALAEDIITHGKEISFSITSKDVYYVYQLEKILIWGCYSGSEVMFILAGYEVAKQHVKILNLLSFENQKFRGVCEIELIDMKNQYMPLRINAEVINYMLVERKINILKSRLTPIMLNGFILKDTLQIFEDEKQYEIAYKVPYLSKNSIVRLKSVNLDETIPDEMAFAHITSNFESFEILVNSYSSEKFLVLNTRCNNFRITFFTSYDMSLVEKLRRLSKNAIVEADVYFVTII